MFAQAIHSSAAHRVHYELEKFIYIARPLPVFSNSAPYNTMCYSTKRCYTTQGSTTRSNTKQLLPGAYSWLDFGLETIIPGNLKTNSP